MSKRLRLQHLLERFKLTSSKAIALMILSVGVVITIGLVLIDREITTNQEKLLATESLYRVRSSLEEAFYKRLSLVVSMEAFVKSHPHLDWSNPRDQQFIQSHFAQFTQSLEQQVPGVLSIQLAPDAIVTNLTNLERNHQAVGHDILKDQKRRPQVLKSIQEKGIIVAGPVTLVQGGDAIIARNAIFTEAGAYNSDRYIAQNRAQSGDEWLREIPADFWGFATVLIDQEKLYQEAGLNDPQGRYHYAIQGRHGLGAAGEVFWGDSSIFDRPLTTVSVSLPNGEWLIGVARVSGINWWRSLIIATLGIGVSGLLSHSLFTRRETELQLKKSNKKLIRATRLKDEFLANMSHELRTPLNAILGMTEGLEEEIFGPLTPQQVKSLQLIESSGNHLLSLINDILDVAKIEAGQMELNFNRTVLAPLITSCLSFIKHHAQKKQIHLEIKQPDHLPDLLLDERRIRQALINLLNNAVKFTPEGGNITIEISFSQPPKKAYSAYLPSQCYLSIAVIDTGIGIASEDINKLFQPFFQIDSALNRQYDGTGLGLALVKQIVTLHGGEITLTSEVGTGSCFTIKLPCSTVMSTSQEMETQGEPVAKSSKHTRKIQSTTPPVILLAEDNEANIITISSYLNAKGYRLILAKDGEEAIAIVKSEKPDLVLMDIQMPEMDGFEAMKKIRLIPTLQNIPIIALTALAMTGDRERCIDAGATDYLSKPVKLKQLAMTLEHCLDPGKEMP